jgi:branched-chain amino acid transport system permease protein
VVVLTVFDESIRSFEVLRPAIYGVMLILSILFLPLGLESVPGKIKAWFGVGTPPQEPPLSDQ